MKISTSRSEGTLTVALAGRLDSASAGEFDKVLWEELKNEPEALVIDMSDLDFVSSKGLRVLVAAYKTLKGKKFTIIGANNEVKEVFRLSGLTKIFDLQ